MQNVRKISIYTRAASPDASPELLFQAALQPQENGKGPQDAVCNFLGTLSGTKSSKDAFYRRLATTEDNALPAEKLPVTLQMFEAHTGESEPEPEPEELEF